MTPQTKPLPLRIGFLASHGGSNMQAILDAIAAGSLSATAAVVISNNSQSTALERARGAGIPARHLSSATHPDPDALDSAILTAMREHGANLIVLAGYMKKLGPRTLASYPHRVLNIHPALLPRHGGTGLFGAKVHEAVLAAGDMMSGATVHLSDADYDTGPIVAQRETQVLHGDTPESLAARVLAVEHALYPDTLRGIVSGEIDLDAIASAARGQKKGAF